MVTIDRIYTAEESAAELGVTDARIRQLCLAHQNIGRKHGYAWLLSEADIEKIRNLPEFGKRRRKMG
jgi:hypothetical protein